MGKIDVEEALADVTFAKAKLGGALVGKTKCGKGTKILVLTDSAASAPKNERAVEVSRWNG